MKLRIKIVYGIFCFLFLLVAGKAFYIQVVNKERLLAYARSQFMREVKEYPNRGNIVDRNGNPLAINIQTYDLFTIPRNKDNEFRGELRKLAQIVPGLTYYSLWNKVKNRTKYTWLARKVKLNEEQLNKLKKLENIQTEAHSTRVYPNHELAGQILGFVGLDNSGLGGIELSLNTELRGQQQVVKYLRDAKGRPVKYETDINSKEVRVPDVALSIDKDIQGALENYLKEAVTHHKAFRGGAGVMDAETGEIIAIANYPTFDPNVAVSSPVENRRLAFATDPFEPGSIFKTLTIASALENQAATAQKRYFCEYGKLRVQNHTISEAESSKKFEWLTVAEILKYSSNVGTTKIAFDLGYTKLRKTLKDFGIGEKTGLQLAGESKGILTKADKVKPLTLSNISFGHGVATTGIQMLQAYAAIANGGYMVRPTLLRNDDSQLKPENRIISAKTAEALTEMMVTAVETGTGTNARIPHYMIAGKTGTAQRVSPKGGYEGYIASFAGYPVNVNRPFVVVVYIDNPKANGYYGNVAAAPVFKKISQYLLYKKKDFARFARYNAASNATNLDQVNTAQSAPRVITPGRIPNFIGMDKASAIKFATAQGLQVEMTGFGIVNTQIPSAGEVIGDNRTMRLHFQAPAYEE